MVLNIPFFVENVQIIQCISLRFIFKLYISKKCNGYYYYYLKFNWLYTFQFLYPIITCYKIKNLEGHAVKN